MDEDNDQVTQTAEAAREVGPVTETFVFLMVDPEAGGEGFCGVILDEDKELVAPILGRNRESMERYLPFLQGIANESGNPIKMVRFTGREEVLTVSPSYPEGQLAGTDTGRFAAGESNQANEGGQPDDGPTGEPPEDEGANLVQGDNGEEE